MMKLAFDDGLTPALAPILLAARSPELLMRRLVYVAVKQTRTHFRDRDREGNPHGLPARHFWRKQIRWVYPRYRGGAAAEVVIVGNALPFHIDGGTIRPRAGHKYLAIPVDPATYRRRPGRVKGLMRPHGRALLATRAADHAVKPAYILAEFVDVPADPRALPAREPFNAGIIAAAAKWAQQHLTDQAPMAAAQD